MTPIRINDSGNLIELQSFNDVQDFLRPPEGETTIGIARTVLDARTPQQQEAAIERFRRWASITGLLEEAS